VKYFILISFLCACPLVEAQVPGFLGKRFTVFLDANPTPAVLVQNTNNALVFTTGNDSFKGSKNVFAFNFRPQVEIDYLLKRDFSAGLLFGYLMTGTTRAYQAPDASTEIFGFMDAAVVKGYSAGLRLKFFRYKKSSTIAPIGLYKTLVLAVNKVNTFDDFTSSQSLLPEDLVIPVASFGIGKQSIIARSLLLKTGVEIGFAMVPFNFITERDDDWTTEEFTTYHLHKSVFSYNLFNVNVALGFIPF
jgi:hypothetical protein